MGWGVAIGVRVQGIVRFRFEMACYILGVGFIGMVRVTVGVGIGYNKGCVDG